MLDLRRRQFITLLSGAVAVWPLTAIAQLSPAIRRVGVLANEPWPPLEGLRDGMRALGYTGEPRCQTGNRHGPDCNDQRRPNCGRPRGGGGA
jgi:hypothetical protein